MTLTNPKGPRVVHFHGRTRRSYEVAGLPVQSPLFNTQAEAEKWLRAQLAKLPDPQRPVARNCLTCGAEFHSDGAHNRMCGRCRTQSSAVTNAASLPSRTGRHR